MMEDEHTLKKIVCEKYPNLPYFLFGHSMGSFITRDFIAKDTLNKLGYKAKINTHTTSCINLFLDIYLYSEYRLIYC